MVTTPIGNLGDLSARAIETLRTVYVVLAEDTRHSRPLLEHYEIATPLTPYHEHNEARETPRILERLKAGESIALISDAGTPLLSDPGARLVRAAIDADIAVVPVPGASALLSALVASGLDADRFTFFGFLPRKGRERTEAFDAVLGWRTRPWCTKRPVVSPTRWPSSSVEGQETARWWWRASSRSSSRRRGGERSASWRGTMRMRRPGARW